MTKNLETRRLRLESIRAEHASLVFEALSESAIYQFIPQDPPADVATLERQFAFLADQRSPEGDEIWLNWVAFLRGSHRPVGTFQATIHADGTADIAYITFVDYWRRGIASEACRVMIDYLFNACSVSQVRANMDTRNVASIRLVEGLGFRRSKTIRGADEFKGSISDEFQYDLSRTDWSAEL